MNLRVVTGAMLACVAVSWPTTLRADEIFLLGGGRLTGEVVERRPDAVVIDVGPGRVTLPVSRVTRIVPGRSAVAVYRARAAALDPHDAQGWLALGLWARDSDLLTLARDAFERALTADPDHAAAHRALGHVRLGARWVTEEESYQARGYVLFEGSWMTPDQARAIASQRTAEAEERRARREAEARAAEAEARVRVAEAEAARAAAEAQTASVDGGIPYPWVFAAPFGFGPFGPPFTGVVPPVAPAPPHVPPVNVVIHGAGRRAQRDRRPPARADHPPARSGARGSSREFRPIGR